MFLRCLIVFAQVKVRARPSREWRDLVRVGSKYHDLFSSSPTSQLGTVMDRQKPGFIRDRWYPLQCLCNCFCWKCPVLTRMTWPWCKLVESNFTPASQFPSIDCLGELPLSTSEKRNQRALQTTQLALIGPFIARIPSLSEHFERPSPLSRWPQVVFTILRGPRG